MSPKPTAVAGTLLSLTLSVLLAAPARSTAQQVGRVEGTVVMECRSHSMTYRASPLGYRRRGIEPSLFRLPGAPFASPSFADSQFRQD